MPDTAMKDVDPAEALAEAKARITLLERAHAQMKASYTLPVNRLQRLEEAIERGEEDARAQILKGILQHQLKDMTDFTHVYHLCVANNLIFAAHCFASLTIERDGPRNHHLNLLSHATEALADYEATWALWERSKEVRKPSERVLTMAYRLGKAEYLQGPMADAGLRQRHPRIFAILDSMAPHGLEHGPSVVSSGATPVYVVNIPGEIHRRRRAERSLENVGLQGRFRRGYKPLDIPPEGRGLVKVKLSDISDGSFGNQYSQYLVWKEIAEGEAEWAVFLEDDMQLLVDPAHVLLHMALPEDWDIIFANPRLDLSTRLADAPSGFFLTPMEEAMVLHAQFSPSKRGYGADCYLLSRKGAAKLVALMESEGIRRVGTDWFLHIHSIPRGALGRFKEGSVVRHMLESRFAQPWYREDVLKAYVLSPNLATGMSMGVTRQSRL
ncbi:hypothetical protein IAI18_14330 [Acetobacteraceae bacterium H6797]|nr:hypothetical protein [Acetobacteraceae bacterium H6797]